MTLCASVMTLCAASSLFVSCDKYDDTELRNQIEELDKRVQNLESLKTQLEALTASVDALYTLKFQVADNNELQYSFDGGQTWKGTGIVLAEQCAHECPEIPECQYVPCDHECPEVSLVDNGDSVTIKVGDAEFTIEKPQEIVFEIRAGKVYFESEGTMTVAIKSSGIEDITVMAAPKGWWAEINSEGKVEITAPDYESTQGTLDYETWEEIPGENAASGYVKVHACAADGKCMVGKIPVEVSDTPLVVKAYGGNAYFVVAGDAYWPPMFYYGISTKESYEADVTPLLQRLSAGDYYVSDDYFNNWGEYSEVEVSIAELLGEEPQQGVEYVVWAVAEDYSLVAYTMDEVVCAYYSPLSVSITEVEAEKTAYNVTVNVEVNGAESYVAVAMPQIYVDDIEYQKEQMVMALAEGQYYGKLYNENYYGSALDIAAGTTYSMTGQYSPNATVYVLILPLDGRAAEDYTAADVVAAEFTTAGLTSGGSIDVTATQVTEYMGKVYSYEIWDYVEQLIKLDPYTQLGVKVELSSNADWSAFYFSWLDAETYAMYAGYDEDLVDYLLENTYGMSPSDIDAWPLYLTEKVNPKTTKHFVAFIVDAAGKYGKLAHAELTSQELAKADFVWADPVESNVVDGVLKNTTTLMFTPAFEGGVEAASYKYVLTQTKYYNSYAGKTDAQMAEELFFATSSSVKTVTAEELVNGVLYVDGHSYGYPYYFAIVPIDAEGKPGASAYILEYETVFALDDVVTEGAVFDATKPEIKINLPADDAFAPDGGYLDGAYYTYQDQTEWGYGYYCTVELNYEITPVAGTEVSAVIFDATSYAPGATAAAKAGQVWSESLGWSHVTTKEYLETSYKMCTWYLGEEVPAHYIYVSWKDAEGNVYFTEYDVTPSLQHYDDLIDAMINGGGSETPETPDGLQLTFIWEDMMEAPSVLDLGVTTEGKLAIAYDLFALYGEDAGVPEEMRWMQYASWDYEVTATDATSGVITISSLDHFGDVQTTEGTYSEWNGETCKVTFDMLMLENVTMTVATETIPVYVEMGGGLM